MHPRVASMPCVAFSVLSWMVLGACDSAPSDAREGQIVSVLASADESLLRGRPALMAGKYVRMAGGSFDFFRGSLPLYRHDLRSGTTTLAKSRFDLDFPVVASLGDPHPENFGALRAADGTFGIEPNDFDAADRAPYLWDVRRLAAGAALAAALSNPDDPSARETTAREKLTVARAAAEGYRTAILAAASGATLPRVVTAEGNPILDDVLSRSARDHAARRELTERTRLEGGARFLSRGVVDPEDPQNVYGDLPAFARESLQDALDRYRTSLTAPPPREHLRVLDAVREFGSGVASWPRARVIVLVRGPSDDPNDDLLLEVKELVDSGTAGVIPPYVYADDIGARVIAASRGAWARPDAEPWWGVTSWLGLRCQVRLESEGQKNVRVARMVGSRGTAEAIGGLARTLGGIVARVHASGPDGVENARAIAKRLLVDPEGFVEEQAAVGAELADLAIADHARFLRALHSFGTTLGVPADADDRMRPDFAAVLGSPPLPPPLPPVPR
ncbi:MAG: DUF2252 family protein [Deltaproteobacteria bacterium]|nr:DUF2252 family protein [Deltaproteobacteria bacterium]